MRSAPGLNKFLNLDLGLECIIRSEGQKTFSASVSNSVIPRNSGRLSGSGLLESRAPSQ
jgi:hypothetical protein